MYLVGFWFEDKLEVAASKEFALYLIKQKLSLSTEQYVAELYDCETGKVWHTHREFGEEEIYWKEGRRVI